MAGTFKKLTYTIAAALVAVLCFLILCESGGAGYASAASEYSKIVTAYENRNVWDDLQGASYDGESIDLSQYGFSERKTPEIISFIEFCYSPFTAKHEDYGLYVYIYNPRGLDFTQNSELNKIQFRVGATSDLFIKAGLQYLNKSEAAGYEGLFYKFKINLSDNQRKEILSTVNGSARVYEVSGIELYESGINATEYKIATKYTYTGYAKGYGAATAQESTLKCSVDGFDTVLNLDVQQTYYRPQGTHKDGYTRDTLHSVYFSVPNDILESSGEMSAIHATWLNALTSPIFVTGNKDIYNELYSLLNEEVDGGDYLNNYNNSKSKFTLVASKQPKEAMEAIQALHFGYLAFNTYNNMPVTEYDRILKKLSYIFYADNGNADTYDLPREKLIGNKSKNIKGWFETFTERFGVGENPVAGKYNADLFENVDEKFTDINIQSDDTYKLTDNIVSNSLWDKLFGTQLKGENEFEVSAIQKVTVKDIEYYPDKELFCDKFYIAERDYEDFCTFINNAAKKEKPETVYLFRYYQSEYVVHEVTQGERIVDWAVIGGNFGSYKVIDSNAYFAQSWAQLDFDIIDVTFTKDNVLTVIPCIMSPIDIIADQEHPIDPYPGGGLPWWAIALIIVAAVVLLVVLLYFGFPVLRGVFKVIGKIILTVFKVLWLIISAPFRGIAALVKRGRERRERKRATAATSAKSRKKNRKRRAKQQKREARKGKRAQPPADASTSSSQRKIRKFQGKKK